MKKFFFGTVFTICLIAQIFFVFAFRQPDVVRQFENLWAGFGVEQTTYSVFVLSNINWFSLLPITCLSFGVLASIQRSFWLALFALLLSVIGSISLYWSIYSPSLLINI